MSYANFNDVSAIIVHLILGLVVGSFLNMLIFRLPRHFNQHPLSPLEGQGHKTQTFLQQSLKILTARSICPHCAHRLAAWQNIPLLSYCILAGRCHACRAPIGWRYPLVEALTALVFALAAWRFGWSTQTLWAELLLASLIVLSAIDYEWQWLPDLLTLPLLVVGLLVNGLGVFVAWDVALFGAILGYLVLYASNALFYQLSGKIGMGGGDFKLTAALGAWLGVYALPKLIVIAALFHLLSAGVRGLRGERIWQQRLPFGPGLALAGAWLLLA